MILAYSYTETVNTFKPFISTQGYTGTHEIIQPITTSSLKEEKLTNFCMQVSEKSLAEVWDKEDDAYWASYLKD